MAKNVALQSLDIAAMIASVFLGAPYAGSIPLDQGAYHIVDFDIDRAHKRIAYIIDGKSINVINLTSNKKDVKSMDMKETLRAVRFFPKNANIIFYAQNNMLNAMELGSGDILWTYDKMKGNIHDIKFIRDGEYIIVGGRDTWVRIIPTKDIFGL